MTPKPRREDPVGTLTIQEAVTETVQRSYGPDGSHIPPKAIAQDRRCSPPGITRPVRLGRCTERRRERCLRLAQRDPACT